MILCDRSLRAMLPSLIREPDEALVNPASIDIRIGEALLYWRPKVRFAPYKAFLNVPYSLAPREFVLVQTLEYITVPNGYALDLRLKSSIARQGYSHLLAFWVDPGWEGILTMEVHNVSQSHLPLRRGMRFAQIIVHQLDGLAERPYQGRYQGATGVEGRKGEEDATQIRQVEESDWEEHQRDGEGWAPARPGRGGGVEQGGQGQEEAKEGEEVDRPSRWMDLYERLVNEDHGGR